MPYNQHRQATFDPPAVSLTQNVCRLKRPCCGRYGASRESCRIVEIGSVLPSQTLLNTTIPTDDNQSKGVIEMKSIRSLFFGALLFLLTPSSHACQFDTDCAVGSVCLKTSGNIYGVCAGGMNPGNSDDRVPVYSPTDPNETIGDTCSFDTDCGPGGTCVKSSGSIKGVCL